jgi:hypothetical protein
VARLLYQNLSGGSGVEAYEAGDDFIRIWFSDGEGYEYNGLKPGPAAVAEMKRLARQGRGRATFINRHVRKNYSSKL